MPPGQPRYLSISIMNVEQGDVYLPIIEQAAAAGINSFLLNVNWDHIYSKRGAAPDWSQVDKQVALIERLGRKVMLRIWVARHDDATWWPNETKPISGDGLRNQRLDGFSYNDPSAVAEANAFIREVVERFHVKQQAGLIALVSVATTKTAEIGYHFEAFNPANNQDILQVFDYSPFARSGFREWAKRKYGNLASLNRAWSSDFSNFSEISPPAVPKDPWGSFNGEIGKDWYLFRHATLKKLMDGFASTVKGVDPNYKLVHDMGSCYDAISNLRGTLGFKDLCANSDGLKVNDDHNYPHRFATDLLRSNLPGKIIGHELGNVGGGTVGDWRKYINEAYEHGVDWVNMFGFDRPFSFPLGESLIKETAAKWLTSPVPDIQPSQTVTYTLSEALRMGTGRVQEQWRNEYAKTYIPIKVLLVEDLLSESPSENKPPVVASPLSDQRVQVGKDFQYSIPEGTFSDPDGHIASINATGLPDGILLSGSTLAGKASQTGEYTVTVTARDNAGAQVSTHFKLTVWAMPSGGDNQPPVVAQTIPNQTATVGTAFSYLIPTNTFTDAETPNQLTLSVSGLPAGLMFTAPATISGTPTTSGMSSVTVTATDPGALSTSTMFSITVNPASVDPTGAFAITGVTTVSCSPVPGNPNQRSLTFTPQYSGVNGQPITFSIANEKVPTTAPGPYTLVVYMDNPSLTLKASQQGTSGQVSFVYNWLAMCGTNPTNKAPTVSNAIPDQTAAVGAAFSYEIPKTTFVDADGSIMGIAITGLPTGVSQSDWRIWGTPTAAGVYTVTVTARDNAGAQVSTQFKLTVGAVPSGGGNQPPVVSRAIPDQTATVGAAFSYEISKATFVDPDGPILDITVTGLPTGVSQSDWRISGTPTVAGVYTVTVTARDNRDLKVSTQFKLTVSAVLLDNTISLFTAGNFITRRFVRDILEGDTLSGEEMKQSVNIMVSPKSGTVGSYSFVLSGPVSITSDDSSTPYGVFGDNGGSVLSAGKYTLTVKSYTNAGLQGPVLSQQVLHFVVMEKTGQQNLPPVLKNPPGTLYAKVGKSYAYRLPDGIFVDPDGSLTSFIITELPEGLKGDGTLISGTPTKKGEFTSKVTVKDNGGRTAEATFKFIVSTDNLPPVVKGSVPDQIVEVNKPFTFTLPDNLFEDIDGTITTITFIGPPEGTIGQGYSIKGVPTKVREYPIIVIATDDANTNAQVTFTIRVVENNRLPVVAKTIGDQVVEGNSDYRFVIPAGTFTVPDGSITRLEISGLPPGVTARGDTLSGRPTQAGEYTVSVRAYDDKGASVQTIFKFTVKGSKPGSTVTPIPDVVAIVGQDFTFDVKKYFKDDEGTLTSITYASALPPGIMANGSQLAGNPTALGEYPIKVLAKDKSGGSIEASFRLKVEKPELRILLYTMRQATKKLIREIAGVDRIDVDTLPPALNLFVESNATLTSVNFQILSPIYLNSTDNEAPFGLFGDTGSFPTAGTYTINILGYRNTTLVASRAIQFTITKTANSSGRLGVVEAESFSDIELWKPYPAPFVDRVKVQTAPQGATKLRTVEVLSSGGRILPLPTSKWTVDQSLLEVDLSETVTLPGVYLLRIIEDNGKKRTLRILKAAQN